MASHAGSPHVAGYKPAVTNGGWGVALLVSALALALVIGAWLVNRATFEDPRDPLSPGSEASVDGGHGAPAADHGAAAGEHAAPAGGGH